MYLPGLTYTGGIKSLIIGAVVFMLINFIMVPLLKLLFLPLNLLTLGLFAWLINVLALYALTTIVSDFMLKPFHFDGVNLGSSGSGPSLPISFMFSILSVFPRNTLPNRLTSDSPSI